MREELEEIKHFLHNGYYHNEEQIRFSLIGRILFNLGWEIWDPSQIFTEYTPEHTRNNKCVDLALFPNGLSTSSIFIEAKSDKTLDNTKDLLDAEKQLQDYNADLTALFTILTDGNQWRFYYSQEGGSFSDKMFKQIKFDQDNIEDIEHVFKKFLKKEEVLNGNGKEEAHSYLKLTQKQKIMEEFLPQAERDVKNDPDLTLTNALVKRVEEKSISISNKEAREFITNYGNKQKEPSNPEPKQPSKNSSGERENYRSNPPDLTHIKIEQAFINDREANDWAKLLKHCLKILLDAGITKKEIENETKLNIKPHYLADSEKGFNTIPGTKFSYQGVNANVAAYSLTRLAQKHSLELQIDFYWRNNPKAANPNKKGRIKVN